MKNVTLLLTRIILILGMCWGADMLVAQNSHGWGNPFKVFCGEPCDQEMRRNFEIEIPWFPNDVIIDSIKIDQIYGIDSNGVLVAHGVPSAVYPIELPMATQSTLPPGASICLLDNPIPPAPTPVIPNLTSCTFPMSFPSTSFHRFFLMEVLVEFGCLQEPDPNFESPVGGPRLPLGVYHIDWIFYGQELSQSGDWQEFTFTDETVLDCYDNADLNYVRTIHSDRATLSEESAFQVYPSHVEDRLNFSIELPETTIGTLVIKDIMGKTVKVIWNQIDLKEGTIKESLDVSMLHDGVYFMEFSSGNSHSTIKFIRY